MSTQTANGKSFEYAILKEFNEKLHKRTNVKIIKNDPLKTAEKHFNNSRNQSILLLYASFAVNFLIDLEPRLYNSLDKEDILELEIMPDTAGQEGDVRDILTIRAVQKWEIGVSAKNNHKAVKHSRLSKKIDFVNKWLWSDKHSSDTYFQEITPIFDFLERKKNTINWRELDNKEDNIYIPILKAFKKELLHVNSLYNDTAPKLVKFLVGKYDFYKVIKGDKKLEIHAFNMDGTLSKSFNEIHPKYKVPVLSLPTKIEDIYFKKNSKTTIIVSMNNNWKLSFRIHNASTKIEPSLKFDITLLESPNSLFKNTLSIQ